MRNTVYVGIDWDKDGNYTDETSRVLIDTFTIRRGRTQTLTTSGFQPMNPADVWGELKNHDGRYDPFNPSSPLYGYIYPARPVRVRVTRGSTTYDLFHGWLTDLRVMGDAKKNAIFRASDGLKFLDMQQCEAITPATYTVAEQMDILITQSDWPVSAGSYIEDNSDSNTGFTPDPKQTIYSQMQEAAEAWGGTILINAAGGFEYRTRDTSQATVATITDADVGKEFQTRNPWDEIYNEIRVEGRSGSAVAIATDATSQSEYGRRTANVGQGINDHIETAGHAVSLANWVVDYGAIAKRVLHVRFFDNFDLQFGLDLMDRVRVYMPSKGIDALYLVGYIEHAFQSAGNCITTMYLEPYYYDLLDQMYPLTFPFTLGW